MFALSFFYGMPPEIMQTYINPHGQSSLVMSSSTNSVLKLERFITSLKKIWNIDDVPFIKMNVSLNEIVSNAIRHGNHHAPDKTVYVQAVRSDDRFAFMIKDQGNGFDYAMVPDPVNATGTFSGQGIFIARNLADCLHYSPKGNCAWLMFKAA